jgi:peptidoglycan hydrolase-like protein with peptidoglycan-binding domain
MLELCNQDVEADGKYGPLTAAAVRRFQVEEHIDPPGGFEVGKRTLHHLDDRVLAEFPTV